MPYGPLRFVQGDRLRLSLVSSCSRLRSPPSSAPATPRRRSGPAATSTASSWCPRRGSTEPPARSSWATCRARSPSPSRRTAAPPSAHAHCRGPARARVAGELSDLRRLGGAADDASGPATRRGHERPQRPRRRGPGEVRHPGHRRARRPGEGARAAGWCSAASRRARDSSRRTCSSSRSAHGAAERRSTHMSRRAPGDSAAGCDGPRCRCRRGSRCCRPRWRCGPR